MYILKCYFGNWKVLPKTWAWSIFWLSNCCFVTPYGHYYPKKEHFSAENACVERPCLKQIGYTFPIASNIPSSILDVCTTAFGVTQTSYDHICPMQKTCENHVHFPCCGTSPMVHFISHYLIKYVWALTSTSVWRSAFKRFSVLTHTTRVMSFSILTSILLRAVVLLRQKCNGSQTLQGLL